ncbi:MAG: hypothetical protein U0992_21080 [Planctomycetaceae bacterium]
MTVVEKSRGFFAYVKTPASIEGARLKLGKTNDTYIEILDGVKEADVVIRNPRAVVAAALEDVSLEERTASRSQFGEGKAPDGEATAQGPTPRGAVPAAAVKVGAATVSDSIFAGTDDPAE